MTAQKSTYVSPGTTVTPAIAGGNNTTSTPLRHNDLPPCLRRNLKASNITAFLLWGPAMANIAFALMLRLIGPGFVATVFLCNNQQIRASLKV